MKKRRDFSSSAVREAYIRQDGVCAYCGRSLEYGFHRHHKDGNPMNNDPDNLELLCPDCHYTTFKEKEYEEHKKLEREMLETLHTAIHKVVDKELSGSALERVLMGISRVLALSRREKGLDDKPERIREIVTEEYEDRLKEWARGVREGLRLAMTVLQRGKPDERE